MPPSFGRPPTIQNISGKQTSARAAASAFVALEIVDEADFADVPDIFHAVRQTGKTRNCRGDRACILHEWSDRRIGQRGILPVVHARQVCGVAEIHDFRRAVRTRRHRGHYPPQKYHVQESCRPKPE